MSEQVRVRFIVVLCWFLLLAGRAYAELVVTGIGDTTRATLMAYISLDDLGCNAPRWWVRRGFAQLETEARRGLETLGYYNAKLTPGFERDAVCWHATLDVERGRRARIGSVDLAIEGDLGSEREMILHREGLGLVAGDGFRHAVYEDAKRGLLEIAEDLGYFDAEFSVAEVRVDPAANRADIRLVLAGGTRYRVGTIEVDQDELAPELFARLLKFETGRYYDAHDLAVTYANVIGSQYFDQVLVSPDLDDRTDGRVTVHITASASSRRTLLFGAGYSTDTGPRARADVQYRRLSDAGHRGGIRTLVSSVRGELLGEYRIPYGNPLHEWLFAEAGGTWDKNDTYDNRVWSLSAGRTHRRFGDWVETNYANFRRDDFSIGGEDAVTDFLMFGTSMARKTVADDPRPMTGYALSVDVRGAAAALVSESDLVQTIVRARHIWPLGKGVRLLSRGTIGWSWIGKAEDLPPGIRFFAGGDNSVRGYDYESLGPEVDGDVVGGRRLLVGSLEIDVPVREQWSVALFGDVGSAYNDSPDFSRGVGVGLRWYSPLGPIRLDFAHPVDDDNRSVRLHITLGPDL